MNTIKDHYDKLNVPDPVKASVSIKGLFVMHVSVFKKEMKKYSLYLTIMFCLGPAEAGTTLATPTVTVVAAPPPTAATMGEVAHEVTTTTSKLISFIFFKIVQYSQVQNLACRT